MEVSEPNPEPAISNGKSAHKNSNSNNNNGTLTLPLSTSHRDAVTSGKTTPTEAVITFCHFDQLFDRGLNDVLLRIFSKVPTEDLEACVAVCHAWRVFIGRHLVCGPDEVASQRLRRRKLPLDWLGLSGSTVKVTRIPITKTLAPPLSISSDHRDILMTTVDSILVWDKGNKAFRGEFGPELDGNNHCMVQALAHNNVVLVTLHKHTSIMIVWSRRNYKIIQEVQLTDMDGNKNSGLWLAAREADVVVWQEDGSVALFAMAADGTLTKRSVLNGHIQGGYDACLEGSHLLTASGDSKVNMWDLDSGNSGSGVRGRLLWSNSRSDARYRRAKLSEDRAVVAGCYDQEGYLQIYHRSTGDVVYEMLTMEGTGFQDVALSATRVAALLCIRHKLLSVKALILSAENGDLLAEQTFVDVLHMRIVCDRALVLVNNQVGDFRTRISVFDLQGPCFERSERVAFQYEHNYWRLPVWLEDGAVIHTSEDKAELVVREFDMFFKQFSAAAKAGQLLTPSERKRRRMQLVSSSTLCQRLRRILFKKLCAKCVIM